MMEQEFDDETLVTFADGELDDATAARLEAALEKDEVLAARLAVFLDSRTAIAAALKPLIHEPVPDGLKVAVQRMAENAKSPETAPDGNVVAFRRKQVSSAPPARRTWLMPIAASLVAVAGIGGFMLGREIGPTTPDANAGLAAALDREVSGRDVALGTAGESLHVVSSFRDEHGDLCREYELRRADGNTISIACREDGAWVTRLALSAPRAQGYTPASAQETIDAYLASIHAGTPLSPEEEEKVLSELR
ncbi:anti-sigma factor family protein [Neorhizobium sp. DT-125]|uniref:anti-sigma factor family protein n=1 Tax=Neorhizobium sp. DT-125 TaxID=3396163 RepID=UPI003F193C32